MADNQPLEQELDKEFGDKGIEEGAREILVSAVEHRSSYEAAAKRLLTFMDEHPQEWKETRSSYRIKDPNYGSVKPVERDAPIRKFLGVKRVGSTTTNTVEIYLQTSVTGGYTRVKL